MAPEQWSRAITVGPASDLYALAVVAFETLTGRRPFEGMSPADFIELHSHGRVPPLGSNFSPALDRMFQRALAKRPEDRFRTALELASALRAASGIGGTRSDLPRVDQDVREAWLAEAPQPLAESVAVLDSARNAHLVDPALAGRVRRGDCARCRRESLRDEGAHGRAADRDVRHPGRGGAGPPVPVARRSRRGAGAPDGSLRRGDHSPSTAFMFARALQPRLAEQARFTSTFQRMWSATFSPDGKQLVTTDDKNAQVWDAQTYRLLFTLPHGDTVYQAVYSNDGTTLVTAGGDGTVRIWDATNGTLARELRHDSKRRYGAVAALPDGKLVAAIDIKGEVVHVWDTATGAFLAELRNDALDFFSLAFSADGRWLATSSGNDVRVFDVCTWAKVRTLAGQRRLSWDPTGPRLLTGSAEGDVSIWAIPSGSRLRRLREIGEPVNRVAFSPNGELAVAASDDGAEQVWDATSGKLRSQGNYLHAKILSVEFDRTSTLVVAAGVSGSVAVADATLGMPITVLDGPRNVVMVAHFDPSSRRVVGASWDGTARIWDVTTPYRRWSSPPISDDCGLVASLEPDRRFVAIGCRDHNTRVWDTAHAELLAELPSVSQVAGDFASAFPAVAAAGDRAAIARGNTVEVYELPGGRLLRTIAHGAAVNAVAFASTGHDLVSGAVDGSLLVTRDNGVPLALPTSSGGIDAAGFLPDSRVVATDAQRRLRVYDPGGAVLADLEIPERVRTMRMSLDSRRLITVPSFMGKAAPPALWDLEHYEPIAQLDSQGQGQVYSARFVVGGQIVTACGDGAVRLWDGATGQLRQTYHGGSRFLIDVTLSPDGSMIVAGGGDGLLRFWDASSGRPLWTMPAHKSHLVGLRIEGEEIVTRGLSGDISRWELPKPEQVIEACHRRGTCDIVSR